MKNKTTLGIKIIIVFLFIFLIPSIPTVLDELNQLTSINSLLRILDIIFRSFGAIFSIVAIAGLWMMKKYGYHFALFASIFQILLRFLIFVNGAKPNSLSYKFSDMIGIITFLLIIFYLLKNKEKFKS